MVLLFDIGNTRLKWALCNAGQIVESGVHDSAQICRQNLTDWLAELPKPQSIWISCVGKDAQSEFLSAWLLTHFALQAVVVGVTDSACGIRNGYLDHERLGVDRWLAAIGARTLVSSGDVIVVDAGTAITIDWLSRDNVYEGGVILPGANLVHDVLEGQTAGIAASQADTDNIIGKTTGECVNSGIIYGLAGAVERIVNEMQKTIQQPASIVLTGGGADMLWSKVNLPAVVEQNLVFIGLLEIAGQGNHQSSL
ncbi:MAG: type III pantothenate kinase [Gammaproteobacteria bacterium]|nr:type III pantothenate kinase [Gammaproteobacteria bacterium]